MHEPLIVGIFFFLPSFAFDPWDWRRVPWMGNFGRALSAMFKAGDPRTTRNLLEFWKGATSLPAMQVPAVRPVLQNDSWTAFLGLSRGQKERKRAKLPNPIPTGGDNS